jgi:hypothetical protein
MNRSALASSARRMPIIALLGAALTIATTQVASAQLTPPSSDPAQPILKDTLAFKSQPDECFIAVGSTGNIFPEAPPCPPGGGQPKVNTSYAWGMTQTGSNVWIGTAVSGLCLTPHRGRSPTGGYAGHGRHHHDAILCLRVQPPDGAPLPESDLYAEQPWVWRLAAAQNLPLRYQAQESHRLFIGLFGDGCRAYLRQHQFELDGGAPLGGLDL